MEPVVIVFLEKCCVLLWPDSGSLSLQFNQCQDVVVRVDGLSEFQEIQKDRPFPMLKDSAHHCTC